MTTYTQMNRGVCSRSTTPPGQVNDSRPCQAGGGRGS